MAERVQKDFIKGAGLPYVEVHIVTTKENSTKSLKSMNILTPSSS
jgi:hypothetical protein